MLIKREFAFIACNACTTGCTHCSAKYSRFDDYNYQLTPDEIDRFIYYTNKSDYHFKSIRFTGGEPLLWDYMVEAFQKLKSHGVVDRIRFFTSLPEGKEIDKELLSLVSDIRISVYDKNKERAKKVAKQSRKIKLVDRTKHIPHIKEALPASLLKTGKCSCANPFYYKNYIMVCSHIINLCLRFGRDVQDYPQYAQPIGKDYLDLANGFKYGKIPGFCDYCVANTNVMRKYYRNHPEKFDIDGTFTKLRR